MWCWGPILELCAQQQALYQLSHFHNPRDLVLKKKKKRKKRGTLRPGVVAHTCNPSTKEAEAGGLSGVISAVQFKVSLGYRVRPCKKGRGRKDGGREERRREKRKEQARLSNVLTYVIQLHHSQDFICLSLSK